MKKRDMCAEFSGKRCEKMEKLIKCHKFSTVKREKSVGKRPKIEQNVKIRLKVCKNSMVAVIFPGKPDYGSGGEESPIFGAE